MLNLRSMHKKAEDVGEGGSSAPCTLPVEGEVAGKEAGAKVSFFPDE